MASLAVVQKVTLFVTRVNGVKLGYAKKEGAAHRKVKILRGFIPKRKTAAMSKAHLFHFVMKTTHLLSYLLTLTLSITLNG